ncbi:integrase catalytic domain-containing protein [Trichonephila clavipes]|nr:integrase catalytic domain-containing protein [Trichonephila clavipes]
MFKTARPEKKNARFQIKGLQDSKIAMTRGCVEIDLVSLHDPKRIGLGFKKAFNAINYLTVPRWVILTADNIVELHGFADASSLAYAAAIYCRQKHNGKIKVQLLVSKTKVAPVKQVSIPRLGFLSWLSGHPRQWKTFVANRTSEIIEVLPKHWRHVPSKEGENPADIASRGIDLNAYLIASYGGKKKKKGPPWLRLETSSWPKAESSCDEASDEMNMVLVRVGGRLQNSQLPFNSKHPIILPSQHSISELLIKEQHIAHLHAGPTLLAHVLRQSHWILHFVVLVLVVVLPPHYSDNGTNFVGARRKLDEIRKLWLSLPTNEAISYYLSKSSIDWHFIPPSSPHFGDIWNQEFDPSNFI